MKKAFYSLMGLFVCFGCSDDAEDQINTLMNEETMNDRPVMVERVSIPDTAFEQALIDLNFDNVLDGEVDKSRIDFISDLIIDDKGISDLTGIAEFDGLVNLNIRNNEIQDLDVTDNTNLLFIWAEGNKLETVNVTGLSSLEKLGLDGNNLEEIDVSTNTGLQLLTVSENQLSGIDVSNNDALTDFTVVDNPLNCILVNQTQLNSIPTDWSKDDGDSYSLDCQ